MNNLIKKISIKEVSSQFETANKVIYLLSSNLSNVMLLLSQLQIASKELVQVSKKSGAKSS